MFIVPVTVMYICLICSSLCMKKFWTKLHSEAPALLPSLEAVLSDISAQLRCADESLRILNDHLHRYLCAYFALDIAMTVHLVLLLLHLSTVLFSTLRKEAQHFEEVASFQEEVEEQLSEIIQEYTMKVR